MQRKVVLPRSCAQCIAEIDSTTQLPLSHACHFNQPKRENHERRNDPADPFNPATCGRVSEMAAQQGLGLRAERSFGYRAHNRDRFAAHRTFVMGQLATGAFVVGATAGSTAALRL